jgi:competence protein ComEA
VLDPDAPSPDDEHDGRPLRRPGPPRSWRERIEDLADATGTTPWRIAVGGVVAVVAVGVTWWLLRPPPAPPEASLPFASTTVADAAAETTGATAPTGLVVHVAGSVVAPGVHELPAGARVVDAIEAAGGLAGDADGARINLAAPLVDGARVYVPAVGEEPPPVALGDVAGPSAAAPTGPVNLNTADAAALEALPGVGPATAAAILEHRTKVGAFTSVDQLLDVPGIGEAKLEALRDLVAV